MPFDPNAWEDVKALEYAVLSTEQDRVFQENKERILEAIRNNKPLDLTGVEEKFHKEIYRYYLHVYNIFNQQKLDLKNSYNPETIKKNIEFSEEYTRVKKSENPEDSDKDNVIRVKQTDTGILIEPPENSNSTWTAAENNFEIDSSWNDHIPELLALTIQNLSLEILKESNQFAGKTSGLTITLMPEDGNVYVAWLGEGSVELVNENENDTRFLTYPHNIERSQEVIQAENNYIKACEEYEKIYYKEVSDFLGDDLNERANLLLEGEEKKRQEAKVKYDDALSREKSYIAEERLRTQKQARTSESTIPISRGLGYQGKPWISSVPSISQTKMQTNGKVFVCTANNASSTSLARFISKNINSIFKKNSGKS